MLDRSEVKRDIVLALIPTSANAQLQLSAKAQILSVADMFVDYIFKEDAKAIAKPKASKKSKKGITAPAAPTE